MVLHTLPTGCGSSGIKGRPKIFWRNGRRGGTRGEVREAATATGSLRAMLRALDNVTSTSAADREVPLEVVALADALAEENELLSGWAEGRPHVFTNMVATLDGAATLAGRSGGLGGEGDRVVFRAIRAQADVILVGAETVRTERYRSAVPPPPVQAWRSAHGLAPAPTVAVVTASGRLRGVPMFDDPDPAAPRPIVYCGAAASELPSHVAEVADVVRSDAAQVHPRDVLDDLGRRGLRRVLAEGGPALLAQLHECDLVDEWFVTIGPIVTGGDAPRLTKGSVERPQELELLHTWVHDGALFLRHRRRPQPASSGGMTST